MVGEGSLSALRMILPEREALKNQLRSLKFFPRLLSFLDFWSLINISYVPSAFQPLSLPQHGSSFFHMNGFGCSSAFVPLSFSTTPNPSRITFPESSPLTWCRGILSTLFFLMLSHFCPWISNHLTGRTWWSFRLLWSSTFKNEDKYLQKHIFPLSW